MSCGGSGFLDYTCLLSVRKRREFQRIETILDPAMACARGTVFYPECIGDSRDAVLAIMI